MSDREPDLVRTSSPLSRRAMLVLGGSGLASVMAGCQNTPTYDDSGGGGNGGSSALGPTIVHQDQSLSEVEFDIVLDASTLKSDSRTGEEEEVSVRSLDVDQSLDGDTTVSGSVSVYSSPTRDHSKRTKVGETEFEQSSVSETHTIEVDLPRGYGQQLHYALSLNEPTTASEETVHTTANALVPFRNTVVGEDMLRVSPPRPEDSNWRDGSHVNQVEVWLNEPDESPFDVPEVYEDNFDPDWYDYRDIEATALVRFATFQDYEIEGQYNVPRYEWVTVNFTLSAWEMLEAFRWNSCATQALETGQISYGSGTREVEDPKHLGSVLSSDIYQSVASDSSDPFTAYHQYYTQRTTRRAAHVNPLWFAASRPFCKRLANEFESALDNPSMDTLDGQEYYKATALKTFVGDTLPWGFSAAQYCKSPEEAIENLFTWSKNDGDVDTACVAATALFGGVAAHLLDTPIAYVRSRGGVLHALPALMELELPDHLPREHMNVNTQEQGTVDSQYGEMALCEATKGESTIGWKREGSQSFASYIQTTKLNTHIPRNEDLEPEEGGKIYEDDDVNDDEIENLFDRLTSASIGMPDAEEF